MLLDQTFAPPCGFSVILFQPPFLNGMFQVMVCSSLGSEVLGPSLIHSSIPPLHREEACSSVLHISPTFCCFGEDLSVSNLEMFMQNCCREQTIL